MEPNKGVPEIFARVRVTSATVQRTNTMISVIEELRTRSMTMFQLADFLGYSPSGTRKYIRDLKNFEMIQTVAKGDTAESEKFALIDDEPAVSAFIAKLKELKGAASIPKIPTRKEAYRSMEDKPNVVKARLAGRQIFTAFDDAPYKLSTERNAGEGKRDSMVAFLFGRKDHHEIVDLPIPEKEQTFDNSAECA